MHRATALAAGMVVGLALVPGAQAGGYPADGRTLRCESTDGKTRECPVDATGGVRMLRQLSKAPCIEGSSWGHMRRSIWVTQGCRAEFLALAGGGRRRSGRGDGYGDDARGDRTMRCGSEDGRWTHCSADVSGRVELVQQSSRSRCVRGQSWGVDRTGIWVNGGCRAEFRVDGGGRDDEPAVATRFRCESDDGKPRACGAVGRGGVRLVRQLSRAECVAGRSWGVARGQVWVDQGCRAEFEADGLSEDGRW